MMDAPSYKIQVQGRKGERYLDLAPRYPHKDAAQLMIDHPTLGINAVAILHWHKVRCVPATEPPDQTYDSARCVWRYTSAIDWEVLEILYARADRPEHRRIMRDAILALAQTRAKHATTERDRYFWESRTLAE